MYSQSKSRKLYCRYEKFSGRDKRPKVNPGKHDIEGRTKLEDAHHSTLRLTIVLQQ